MKPIEFKGMDPIPLKPPKDWDESSHGECVTLPVNRYQGEVISCWQFTWKERLRVLIGMPMWVHVFTGSGTQPPVALSVRRKL